MLKIDPFDEAKDVPKKNVVTFSGSNLSAVDPYRQGIELQTEEQYYQGLVKIHSGYPEHKLPQVIFGQEDTSVVNENWYQEVDTFSVLPFIEFDTKDPSIAALRPFNGAFTRTSSSIGDRFDEIYDGVLEPLSIRSKLTRLDVVHSSKASSIEGNERRQDGSSDSIAIVYSLINSPNLAAFVDSMKSRGSTAFHEDFEPLSNILRPWIDERDIVGSVIAPHADPYMISIILSLNMMRDNLSPPDRKSTTCGFVYDTAAGTDSLSFGGFTHISSSVSLPPVI
jgi:hypothetical protein